MKLQLKNFKKYKDLTLDIPDTGMVRLDGASGAGKTSIIQAIAYALYGKTNGSVNTWGEKSSSVKLEYFGLNIERTRGPNEITCNGSLSDEADALIASKLGMSRLEFELSSYIKQQQENSILALSPAEQLNLIHQIAFNGFSPSQAREKIKLFMNDRMTQLKILESSMESQESILTDLVSQIDIELKRLPDEPEHPANYYHQEIAKANATIGDMNKKLQDLELELKGLRELKDRDIYSIIRRCKDYLEKAPQEVEKFSSWLRSNPPLENDVFVNDKIADCLERKRNLNKRKAELVQLKESVKDSEKYKAMRNDLWKKYVEAHTQTAPQELTPRSGDKLTNLSIVSEKLVKYLAPSSSQAKTIEDIDTELQSIEQEFQDTNKELHSFESAKKRSIERQTNIKNTEEELKTVEKNVNIAKDRLSKYEDIIPEDELISKIESLLNDKNNISSIISSCRLHIEECKSEVSKYSIWQTCQDRLGALEARRDSTIELLASNKKDADILKDEIVKSSQLMDLAAKAGLQSISSTLDEINNRAKYWIDQLFDGEVTATLVPFKKLKSKDEVVDKISLDVYFNGTKLSDYNDDLSGGQRTRLRAAFNLAMCDLYNSPILILDEAFSGVDSNTIMDCLAAIHPISQRKLVLVIEHGSSGYEYDHVINIEEVM